VFPAFAELRSCLEMVGMMLKHIQVKPDLLKDPKYQHLFTVEAVNQKVLEGLPFRDAYREVGAIVEKGQFQWKDSELRHTHEGSIGNLGLESIEQRMQMIFGQFPFEKIKKALAALRAGA
jgi:argininosuccinate lyase